MKTYQVGIIGYGGFGQFLHKWWDRLENVRVAAIADALPEKLAGLQGVKTFADWRVLIQEPDLDVIAIVTVPDTHMEMANACMEAGKHVFIEKPLAATIADAQSILATRDRTGRIAAVDFIMRFNPLIRELKKLSRLGVFGRLRRVDVENYAQDESLGQEHWFWDQERSGGILVEHGVHFIDLVHFLNPAKVLAVNGLKHDRNERQEDQILANAVYEGGLIATHYHSFARPGFFEVNRIKLAFDLADIELHGWIPLWGEAKILVNDETKNILVSSPLFKPSQSIPVAQAADDSRPEGWGTAEDQVSTRRIIRAGGLAYEVDEVLNGRFDTGRTKLEVYASCVQTSLLDIIHKIENPDRAIAAPLEAGLASLEVAIRASESARAR